MIRVLLLLFTLSFLGTAALLGGAAFEEPDHVVVSRCRNDCRSVHLFGDDELRCLQGCEKAGVDHTPEILAVLLTLALGIGAGALWSTDRRREAETKLAVAREVGPIGRELR